MPEIALIDVNRACAGMGKPVVVTAGMASPEEISAAASAAGHNAILLHCVSAYPTPLAETHLREMLDLPCERRGGPDPVRIGGARVIAALAPALRGDPRRAQLLPDGAQPLGTPLRSPP